MTESTIAFDGSTVTALERFSSALEVQTNILQLGQRFPNSSNQKNQIATFPLRQYMLGPIISDGFSNHTARVGFLSVLEKNSPSTYDFYQANRLRFNNLYSLSFVSADFYDGLEKFPNLLNLWKFILSNLPKTSLAYESLPLAKKIRLVRAVSTVLERILKTL